MRDFAADQGVLSARITSDGSFSLFSCDFQEGFHSSAGALEEANSKFVAPAQLDRFTKNKHLRVLDVCFGLGYNTAALAMALPLNDGPSLECWALELDDRPLKLALADSGFKSLWPEHVLAALIAISSAGHWQDSLLRHSFQMLWGDARKQLHALPFELTFDLILLDAFSPGKCPQLWSEQFLHHLADRLHPGGRLLTYCRAASIRNSFLHAGLELRSLLPKPGQGSDWSSGTMACRRDQNEALPEIAPGWSALSTMEQEHLETQAGVPYRDPSGTDDSALILRRRQQEQVISNRPSTSAWQRKWMHLNNY